MKSNAFGRLISGPVGSGKTTAVIIELLRRSVMQAPAPDGYRYTRWAVTRQTLKQLKDTVLKDCDTWIGANGMGTWKVSEGIYHVQFDDVRSEWVFIPLEDSTDQARLLSMQLTGAWLSECTEMDISVLGPISGRLGRYPSGARGNVTWSGIVADTNMPVEMSDWYNFMENLPPDWQHFHQPGGMTPLAENLNWLLQTDQTIKLPVNHPVRVAQGRKYYERLVDMYGENSDWVKRYVHSQYGDDPSGQAVFRNTFIPSFHILDRAKIGEPIPGYPILLAQDFGRNPWTLICQTDHMGRLLVHDEVRAENVGLEKHILSNLLPVLRTQKYMGFRMCMVGDPAGAGKDSISEESCFDCLKRLGFPAVPAPTNEIEPRLRAVESILGRQVMGGPALAISREGCPHLCRAMSGGYRFVAKKGTGAMRWVPDKDDKEGFSHVADCLQMAALVVHGQLMPYVMNLLRPPPPQRPPMPAGGWT